MNLFLIDKNENVIGVIPDSKIIDLTQSLEINQADVLNGTITLDKSLKLDDVRYFAVPDRDNMHNLWMYRKTIVKVNNDNITIQGVNAFYDDLKAYGYIKDKRPNNINAEQAVRLVLGKTRWNIDFVDTNLNSSNAEVHDTNFYYLTYLDSVKKIEDTWTVEIQPFINIEGNKITRKYVNLYQQMGGNKGNRFVYGKSALQIVKESNDTDVYTALIGRGSGIAEQDENGNDTGGYSRKITFSDIEWSKSKGDPLDKPKGQEWVEWPQATREFGYSDGTPRFGIVEFQNEEDPANLLKETYLALQKSAIPAVQFSAVVGDVGFLNLGETVAVVRYDLDIKYQTRVIKIEWNRKNEQASQITLGDKLVQTAADRYRSVQSEAYKARDIADQATVQANFAIDNAGTNIQWGSNEPSNPKEGDIWYDKQSDGTVVMKQYENGQWIILIDDTTGQQIKNKVDQAISDGKQLKIDTDKKISDFNTQVNEAKGSADSALTIATNTQSQLSIKVDSEEFHSSINQLDNYIQTKVSNDEFESKTTQLANGIQSNVESINNINAGGINLLKNTKTFTGTISVNDAGIEDVPKNKYKDFTTTWALGAFASLQFPADEKLLEAGKTYTVSAWLRGSAESDCDVRFYSPRGWVQITNHLTTEWVRYHATFVATNSVDPNTMRCDIEQSFNIPVALYVAGIKLEKGKLATEWSPAPEEMATQSQITQLSDNINMRVQKNDIINQINISTEGILIDGKRTHITGQTTIDNAVIKNEMVDELSANKITSGAIDANNIKVIHLTGYDISARTIMADRLGVNQIMVGLNNSLTNMQIYPDGLTITKNGNLSFVMNQTGMHVWDYNNNEDVGWIHANSMNGAPWFNGLVFDLNDLGDYIGFGVHDNSTNLYNLKFVYYKNGFGSHWADTIVCVPPIEFVSGNLIHNGATLEMRNSWYMGQWNLPTLGRSSSYIMFGDTDVFVVIMGKRYSMYDVIHSIGRNQTWN